VSKRIKIAVMDREEAIRTIGIMDFE